MAGSAELIGGQEGGKVGQARVFRVINWNKPQGGLGENSAYLRWVLYAFKSAYHE